MTSKKSSFFQDILSEICEKSQACSEESAAAWWGGEAGCRGELGTSPSAAPHVCWSQLHEHRGCIYCGRHSFSPFGQCSRTSAIAIGVAAWTLLALVQTLSACQGNSPAIRWEVVSSRVTLYIGVHPQQKFWLFRFTLEPFPKVSPQHWDGCLEAVLVLR